MTLGVRGLVRKYLPIVATLITLALVFGQAACGGDDEPKKVGILTYTDQLDQAVNGLKDGLAELGFVEGQHVEYVYLNIQGDTTLLEGYATELVEAKVDVILSISTPASVAMKEAAEGTEVPVIFTLVGDPLAAGLVESLPDPGGNMSGVMGGSNLTAAKRLEKLVEMVPDIQRLLLVHSNLEALLPGIEAVHEAALALEIELVAIEVSNAEEAKAAYTSILPGEVDAVFIPPDPAVVWAAEPLLELVKRDHIPAFSLNDASKALVMTFGPGIRDMGAQAAAMVAKVLSGAAPGTLPVELPRRQYLTVFLERANEYGIEFSDEALSLADIVLRE